MQEGPTVLLRVLVPVRLDLLHPRRIRLGVQHRDDDDGRAAPDGHLGDVGQRRGLRPPAYPQQPEQCEEAQHGADHDPRPAPQQLLERGRHQGRAGAVARGIGRRPRRLARGHGEVHGEGEGGGEGARRPAATGRREGEGRSGRRMGWERGYGIMLDARQANGEKQRSIVSEPPK